MAVPKASGIKAPQVKAPGSLIPSSRSASVASLASSVGAFDSKHDSSDILTSNTDDFIIGDHVWVNGTKPGFIQYIGETQFAPGEWAGVVLEEAVGKNDGSVSGVRYFQCSPKRGIFARLHRLTRRPSSSSNGGAISPATPRTVGTPVGSSKQQGSISPTSSVKSGVTPGTRTTISNTSTPPKVGDRVVVNATSGIKNGTLKFLGKAEFATGQWAGVELDEPNGKNDGSVAGRRYFTCKMKYGLFAPAHKVLKATGVTTVKMTRTHISGLNNRCGSHESLNSSLSSTSGIARAGRVRLGVTALTSTQRQPHTLGHSTTATNNALQETLREKEEHIEQLLKERDLERSEVARAAVQVENSEQQLVQLRSEHQKLLDNLDGMRSELNQRLEVIELEKNELLLQQEDDKKKIEDLQFRLEEESIGKGDLEAQCEENKNTIQKLKEELARRGKDFQTLAIKESDSKEKDDLIFQLQTTLETKKSELGTFLQRLTEAQEELNRSEERHRKQLGVIDDLNLKLSRYESFSNELTEELQNLKSSCSDLERQQRATEERCDSLNEEKTALEHQLTKVTDNKSKVEQQLTQVSEKKSELEQEIGQLRDEKSKVEQELAQSTDDKTKLEHRAKIVSDEKSRLEQRLTEALDEVTKLKQEHLQSTDKSSKLEKELGQLGDEKSKLEQQLKWLSEDKSRLDLQLTQSSTDQSGQLASLGADLQDKRREVERLQEQLKATNHDKEELQETLQRLEEKRKTEMDNTGSNLHKAEDSLKAKNLELEMLQEHMTETLSKLDRHVFEMEQLREENNNIKADTNKTKSELESRIRELTTLHENEKIAEDEKTNRGREGYISEIANLRLEIEKAGQEAEKLRGEMESRTTEVAELRLECGRTREEANKFIAELESKTTEMSKLRLECSRTAEEAERLKREGESSALELVRLLKEKEEVGQLGKTRGQMLETHLQEIAKLQEDNQRLKSETEKSRQELQVHVREKVRLEEERLRVKEEAEKTRNEMEGHVRENAKLHEENRRICVEIEKTRLELESEKQDWEQQLRKRISVEREQNGKVGDLESQVAALKAEVRRLQEEYSRHREDIMVQMREALEQNKAMENLDDEIKQQEDSLEKLQVQLFQSEEDSEKLRETLAVYEKAKNDLMKENKSLIERLDGFSAKSTDTRGYLQKLEEEKIKLENKVVELQVAVQQSRNAVNGADPDLKSFQEEKEAFTGQIEFLNSVIVDMQKKNDDLNNKIRVLEEGDILDLNLNGVKTMIAPRLFCDICERFDLHDTEDCPTQAAEPELPIHSMHQGSRKDDRPYCESCEVFGHWTKDCDDNETF